MSKSFLRALLRQYRLLAALSPRQYLRYLLARRGTVLQLRLLGELVTVRRGTPDLRVAAETLGRELLPVSELLPRDFDGLIVDAGGYIGTAAIRLARLYPYATVVTVEPSSENAEILARNIAPLARIHLVQAALAPRSGESIALSRRGTGAWGFTIIARPLDQPDAPQAETVETVSLGEISRRFGGRPIGLLKLDIEGAEKQLCDEDAAALAAIPAIFAELHDRIVAGCGASFRLGLGSRWIVPGAGEKLLSLAAPVGIVLHKEKTSVTCLPKV